MVFGKAKAVAMSLAGTRFQITEGCSLDSKGVRCGIGDYAARCPFRQRCRNRVVAIRTVSKIDDSEAAPGISSRFCRLSDFARGVIK